MYLSCLSGVRNGMEIKFFGKGMPIIGGSRRGNVVVQVLIKIPKRLSKKQKDLLGRFLSS